LRIEKGVTIVALAALLGAAAPLAQGVAQSRHGRLFPPEDLGLLESPDRDVWQKPERIMDALGIADGSKVADVGAGGGWFTVRLARRVGPNGRVYAEDVQPQMREATQRRAAREGLGNITYILGTATDPTLPAGTLDAVLIIDAYGEIPNPLVFLQNVRGSLKPGGRVGIVDYKREGGGPGPDGARPDPASVEEVARAAGLRLVARETFLPFQFFLVFAG
jgi:ubiquinone/menaquinone biosynthesis C-methylase UbiE